MKILYYFKEKDVPMDKWQRFYIFGELERHDCHIEVFNPLKYETIEEANEKLLVHIKNNYCDLFMTPHGSDDLFVETLLKIKQRGVPTLLICFDNLIVPFNHHNICRYFDLVWLTSKETESMFIKWGANVLFNPYAANPFFSKPRYEYEIEKIVFIGAPYGSRANMLNILTENQINVSLFATISSSRQNGNKSKKRILDYLYPVYNLIRFNIGRKIILGAIKQKVFGSDKLDINNEHLEIRPSVDFNELSTLYSNYAISLSSTAARNTGVLNKPVNVVNLRSFEIPMCGGLQICSYFDELAEYFEEDKEIVFYRNNYEFVDKTRFYLKPENEKLREKMKIAARKRAEGEHTWFCRFKKAFDCLGLEY